MQARPKKREVTARLVFVLVAASLGVCGARAQATDPTRAAVHAAQDSPYDLLHVEADVRIRDSG